MSRLTDVSLCRRSCGSFEVYPDDEAEDDDLIAEGGVLSSWWTLGEEGAEVSGVEISSMSAYGPDGLEPFLLKALLKELRNYSKRKDKIR